MVLCFVFKWIFKFFQHPVTRKERGREGDTCQKVMCLVLSEQTHFWFYQPKILYINHDWIKRKMQPKQGAKNKFVIHLLREPGSGLVTIMQSSAVQFSAYMGHGTHPKYRLHFCGWVTYTFFSCVFLNCQLSWLISTLSHVLELRNDILWIKCWDFSPFLHCKCIIWCLGWWDRINWYQPKVLLIRIHS